MVTLVFQKIVKSSIVELNLKNTQINFAKKVLMYESELRIFISSSEIIFLHLKHLNRVL